MATKEYIPLKFKGDDKVMYLHPDCAAQVADENFRAKFDALSNSEGGRYQQELMAMEMMAEIREKNLKSPVIAVKSTEKVGDNEVSKWNFLAEETANNAKLSISLGDDSLGQIVGKAYLPPAALPDAAGNVAVVEAKDREYLNVAARAYRFVPDFRIDLGSEPRSKKVESKINDALASFIKWIPQGEPFDAAKSNVELRKYLMDGVKLRDKPFVSTAYDPEKRQDFYDGAKSYLKNYISFGGDKIIYWNTKGVIERGEDTVNYTVGRKLDDKGLVLRVDAVGGSGTGFAVGDVIHLKMKKDRNTPERPMFEGDFDPNYPDGPGQHLEDILNNKELLREGSLIARVENDAVKSAGYVDDVGNIDFLNTRIQVDERAGFMKGGGADLSGVKVAENSVTGLVDKVLLDSVEFDYIKGVNKLDTEEAEKKFFQVSKDGITLKYVAGVEKVEGFGNKCGAAALYGALQNDGADPHLWEKKPSYALNGMRFAMIKCIENNQLRYELKCELEGDYGDYESKGVVNKVDLYRLKEVGSTETEKTKTIERTAGEGEFAFAERLKKSITSDIYGVRVNSQHDSRVIQAPQERSR